VSKIDWVRGDATGLDIPAHGQALRAGGTAFLTRALRAFGVLAADNAVRAITRFEDCPGGSTGAKLFLSLAYDRPQPGLHEELFVKFSRDFDDPIRDRARNQLEAEVRFAALSRTPGFPIIVPDCAFADYHHDSGTGLLITQAIGFGRDGIEPHRAKCLDYDMADPLEHYRLLVRSLARLAGTHKAGGLPATVEAQFPCEIERLIASDPIRYDARQLQNRVQRFADFAARTPQLWPANIRDPAFLARLREEVVLFHDRADAIRRELHRDPALIALCHWNGNIDNGWFWRDGSGQLQCGLMDWGHVGQMHMALALWGMLSGAEIAMWDAHLDALLALFVGEVRGCGGPAIPVATLRRHLFLFIALLGLAWLMDAPPLIARELPEPDSLSGPHDPRFRANETARTQLHMMSLFLHLWQRHDFGALLRGLEAEL
jgi:hypothetical protein